MREPLSSSQNNHSMEKHNSQGEEFPGMLLFFKLSTHVFYGKIINKVTNADLKKEYSVLNKILICQLGILWGVEFEISLSENLATTWGESENHNFSFFIL